MEKDHSNIRCLLHKHAEQSLTIAAVITILCGTIFYHFVERWTWIDSVYFSIITLATVGYGDIYPITTIGKVFTMFYIIIGVGIIFGFINAIYQRRVWK